MMDDNTAFLVRLIRTTGTAEYKRSMEIAKRAFIDYLASSLAARHCDKVESLAKYIQSISLETNIANQSLVALWPVALLGRMIKARPEEAALFNGFQSHYLDYDDAQANIAGHFSTVLFSALLAMATPKDTLRHILEAYILGAEVEGLLGERLNPAHKKNGWHSTGTVGPVGAAVAIGKLRGLDEGKLVQLISFSATQSAGMGFEAGSDGKPLHAGMAARNAVWAYRLVVETDLEVAENIFNDTTGWLFTFGKVPFEKSRWQKAWFSPGQLLSPGLWMKLHQYCSAAICGAAACAKIRRDYLEAGYTWNDIGQVVLDFPNGADTALRYTNPQSGQEGRFSMEFVAWQELALGGVDDALFMATSVPEEFRKVALSGIFVRQHTLTAVEKTVRITRVIVRMKDGNIFSAVEDSPIGSPQRPLSDDKIKHKLACAIGEKPADILYDKVHKDIDTPCDWTRVINAILGNIAL